MKCLMRSIVLAVLFALSVSLLVIISGCNHITPSEEFLASPVTESSIVVTSTAFEQNEVIPSDYSCDGDDINPDLSISGIPEKAKTLALVVYDPDAPGGTWIHWIVWNIPIEGLSVIIEKNSVPGIEGTNSFSRTSYGGPCPPSGTHRYFFRVFVLDEKLDLNPGSDISQLINAIEEKVIDQGELIGTYSKK